MSRFSKDSKFRIRDFKRRASYGEAPLINLSGQQYISVHPFSDDTELLARLGIGPDQCVLVDAYWLMATDVCFLEVSIGEECTVRVRWPREKKAYLNIHVTVPETDISREVFETVMEDILAAGCLPSEALRSGLSDQLIDISKLKRSDALNGLPIKL